MIGEPRHHHDIVDSTNDRARDLIDEGAPSGTIVTATEQTAGRGRQGRTWMAPPGKALLFSVILRSLSHRHRLLPLAVPLAVCETAEGLGAGECRVKWPNDVWRDGRKLAGVLIEARPPDWAVIGIGLNVAVEPDEFPEELRGVATSIGGGAEVEDALEELCGALDRWIGAPDDRVLRDFRRRDALAGREIRWTGAGEGAGLVEGVDDDGNLLVRLAGGETRALGSGEIHLKLD